MRRNKGAKNAGGFIKTIFIYSLLMLVSCEKAADCHEGPKPEQHREGTGQQQCGKHTCAKGGDKAHTGAFFVGWIQGRHLLCCQFMHRTPPALIEWR